MATGFKLIQPLLLGRRPEPSSHRDFLFEVYEQGAALNKPRTINEVLISLETCGCTQFAQLIRERLAL
jgi:hypothetical protein